MFKKLFTIVILVVIMSSLAAAQRGQAPPPAAPDAKTVIANASKALGADNLKTIQYSGEGADFSVGQNVIPSAVWPRFNLRNVTRTLDLEGMAIRHVAVRTQGENPARGGGGQPLAGEQNQDTTTTASSPWAAQIQFWLTPYGFLKGAAAANATMKSQTIGEKKYNVISFAAAAKSPSGIPYTLNGFINDQNVIEKIQTSLENTVLGDVVVEASFGNYQDFGGVRFPTRMIQKQHDLPTLDLTITKVTANVPFEATPQRGAGPGAQAAGPGGQAAPASRKLAEGVYLITGAYRSVAVEFRDHIVVIEGPQNDAIASAIIAETKRLIPNKPIRYVVNTHHHFDHSGGLRAFVAEGATIITHQMNKPFYEKAYSAPRTLAPDKLSEVKKAPAFETFFDKKVLQDSTRTLELHHLIGNPHNAGMIVAYLPKEKIIVEADVFNVPAANAPPNPTHPFWSNFASELDRLKLDYQTLIPIHAPNPDREVPKADFMKALGKG